MKRQETSVTVTITHQGLTKTATHPNPPPDHIVEQTDMDNTTLGVYNLMPPCSLPCLWGGEEIMWSE